MSKLFIKFFRDEELFLNILNTHFPSYALLSVIAQRVRLSDDIITGLKKWECYIGDYDKMGMSEQQYRTAKANLNKWQFANFKATNKGTISFLLPNPIFDIYTTDEITNKQRTANERPTTNKEYKKKEEENTTNITVNHDEVYMQAWHLSITHDEFTKLSQEFGEEKADDLVRGILNYRKNTKYKSLYLTAIKWWQRDKKERTDSGTKKVLVTTLYE